MKTKDMLIFYHIPKNSGTYVFISILTEARKHNKNNVQIVRILLEDKYVIAKFIVINNINFLEQCSKFTSLNHAKIVWDLSANDLTEDLLQTLSIHSIFIEARGFRCTETSLKSLFMFLTKFNLHKYIILREPFSREQSLYHYLTSDKSKHEYTHRKFKSSCFQEHVMSNQLQDSWLIRALLNLPNGRQLTEDYFNKALETLRDFNVYDAKNTDKAISEMLLKCFNIQDFDKQLVANKKHDNTYKKIKFEELSQEAQKVFTERTYWDNKLYNTAINT